MLFSNDPALEHSHFIHALNLMRHRGPDVAGCHAHTVGAHLGHNRLSILDLDRRSDQPFASRDGRYQMIYNGEVYNYRELARRYGIEQRTTGDTEVLVELYARLGERMLDELNGMFALVILDTRSTEIFAARDRLGIKPLYHRQTGNNHTLSSEIAPILELYPEHKIDEVGLRQYQKLRTFFNGRTLYQGISMFPAGCYLKDGRIHRYWSLPEGEQDPPSDEELRELVESAVAYRQISDVPVGSYLSGGLDSTIVAGLADRPHTWTVGTEESNEFEWATIAARRFGTKHHEVLTTDKEFLKTAKEMVRARGEPLSVPNEVLLYTMTSAVKEHNTVVLSGEGADELFFGYDRIFNWAAAQQGDFDIDGFDRFYSYGGHRDPEILEDALSPFMGRGSTVDVVAAFFQVAHLHGLLRRLDNSTMLCSVEARVPFVDHRLVERMAGVAYHYRVANGIAKAPLKRVFSDLVPQAIVNRPKVGFPVDLESVFKDYGPIGASPMDKWLTFNLEVLETDD
ncbi:asparagine synthase (glutamine-hydrolyzing) [Serinicoccus marinus]|uniref:asparagine synthase (glutamine-hydrolyzing) n=1 Tax=Serinicoccus marinus TaxID=247333 RepID=UPI00192BEACF|nr:asparagine synthase (glutamine-hydrolyzing) [Serinicoccus marinus]